MPTLYDYQKDAVGQLLNGKHFVISGTGSGKGAMAVVWAKSVCDMTGKNKVLVVTTASKSRTGDFEDDADLWNGEEWRTSLSYFSVISWHKLKDWTSRNWTDLKNWVVIFDEVAKASAGASSGMGKSFLNITKYTNDWAGFTATPGDVWLKFYPYFQACGLVKNKTCFLNEFATVATYKGFPEIVRYLHQDKLKDMWKDISTAPDTSKMLAELPPETHTTKTFKTPKNYKKVIKERRNAEGELLDTSGALCSELRRMCFTADKQEWLRDFVEGLGTNCVFFYNFIKTGDELQSILSKALPKGAKVWRIDGKVHDIPTAETIGKYDVVICQWQSGSEALNFQFMNYWCAVELCYSYSTAIQARGRIKRIGQKKNMHYYYLLTDGTIEQDILKCLKSKGEFASDIWLAEQGITFE